MSFSKSRRHRPQKKKSHKKLIAIVVFLVVIGLIVGVVAFTSGGNNSGSVNVRLETSMGNIIIQLRDDMPITTSNFVGLVQQGVYNNTIFHRVVNLPGDLVIIQGGDPTGTGYGDPSIPSIPDEFSDNPENNENRRGTIAMANAGANTGSSQFFINGEYNSHLDNVHPVFGDIIEGMDVVDEILNVQTDANDKPVEDVILITAILVD
jgi:peptidylprolyl isomerase